ncbi:MAG: oligoendopeptidase F [Bacillota bacterium]
MKKRNEINQKYKWDLSSLYKSEDNFNNDFDKVFEKVEELKNYKGKITQTSDNLLKTIELSLSIKRIVNNLYAYSKMKSDENTKNSKYQKMFAKIQSLNVNVNEELSFIVPEILREAKDKIKLFINNDENLKLYKKYLEDILRQKDHFLSEDKEKIMAQAGDIMSGPSNTFNMLNNADFTFPKIKDENNEDLQLTHGNFIKTLKKPSRDVRKSAFKAYYSVYEKHQNGLASNLATQIKTDCFNAKVRDYKDSLTEALDQNNIPTKVYNSLIKAVHDNIDAMHKYMRLKKEFLNLDELHLYDIYAPLVKDVEFEFPFDNSKDILLDAFEILGKDYTDTVKSSFNNRWIDVYETKGKRSGAYSFGTYDSNPYILLNYQDNLNSLYTLAHEMGHSMHSYLTRNNQPYVYGNYSIFLAEIASTTNEALLTDHFLNTLDDKKKKLYILNDYLEKFRGTLFRQTMFAEFEKFMHKRVENSEPLTTDILKEKYKELNQLYYGDDVYIDEEIALEWARIPHFYYNYYVYQYATGFAAAINITDRIKNKEENIVKKYIEFLSSGSEKYPIDLLKDLGLDMTSVDVVTKALKRFKYLVDEMEKLIEKY